ncbi:hypothetical protein D3C85_1638240 [compost metagenome]
MLAIGLFFTFLLAVFFTMYLKERRDWNNGINKLSGNEWVKFATDSSGAIGYRDTSKDRVIWLSYFSPSEKGSFDGN